MIRLNSLFGFKTPDIFILLVYCLESVDLGTDVNEKMLSLTVEMWDCGGRAVSTSY